MAKKHQQTLAQNDLSEMQQAYSTAQAQQLAASQGLGSLTSGGTQVNGTQIAGYAQYQPLGNAFTSPYASTPYSPQVTSLPQSWGAWQDTTAGVPSYLSEQDYEKIAERVVQKLFAIIKTEDKETLKQLLRGKI